MIKLQNVDERPPLESSSALKLVEILKTVRLKNGRIRGGTIMR
jgi:hypothetical protein